MIYLSHYEEYPIYEEAEGGYYYAGVELVESEQMSVRKAKKEMKKFIDDINNGLEFGEFIVFSNHSGRKQYPGSVVRRKSKYVGEGGFWCIERKQGCHERGKVAYC